MSGNNSGNNNTVKKIINDSNKAIHEVSAKPGGILAKLFRQFLTEGNINQIRWNDLMNSYVKQVERGEAGSRANLTSVRGNTTKFLSKPSFTWTNFINALKFLQTKKLTITVTREDWHGRTYQVSETIEFRNNQPVEEEEE